MARINDVVEPNRVLKADVEWDNTKKTWPNGRITVKRNWSAPLHEFELEWDGINLTEYDAIKAHFNSNFGDAGVFELLDPHDNVLYNVRYADSTLSRRMVRPNTRGLYKIKVKFIEDRT